MFFLIGLNIYLIQGTHPDCHMSDISPSKLINPFFQHFLSVVFFCDGHQDNVNDYISYSRISSSIHYYVEIYTERPKSHCIVSDSASRKFVARFKHVNQIVETSFVFICAIFVCFVH